MIKLTDKKTIHLLEIIAMVGEINADKLIKFFNSGSYMKKKITVLKKEGYIKKVNNGDEDVLRLTTKAKKQLKKYLPKEYGDMIIGPIAVNLVKGEKRRNNRRNNLIDVLIHLHNTGVKIFFDEKIICKSKAWQTGTDNTDKYYAKNSEFYTSTEIRFFIPEYKKASGSRALGVLITEGKVFVIYMIGDKTIWRQEREINYQTITLNAISRNIFGSYAEVGMILFGKEEKNIVNILERYEKVRPGARVVPTYKLSNMLFALIDEKKDATIDLMVNHSWLTNYLLEVNSRLIKYDETFPDFHGTQRNGREMIYFLFAFEFDVYKVARALDYGIDEKYDVRIACYEFQKPFLEKFLDGKEHNVKIIPVSHKDKLKELKQDE